MEQAIRHAETTGEHMMTAELYRLKGEFLLEADPDHAAQARILFERGREIAREQSAKTWELRCAVSLARLLRREGRTGEAIETLAPVYEWFTEGFDTNDLRRAKALLDELRQAG